MNHEQASRLIKTTLEAPYDEERFRLLTRNLLNSWEESYAPAQAGSAVSEAFRDTVTQLKKLGGYSDTEGRDIDVLAVRLRANTTLERGRTAQRNFIARYLDATGKDAALVAFSSEDTTEWRFSLIKLELSFKQQDDGKGVFQKTLTPAKRFSFLVGPSEGSHTAQRRLVGLLEDEVAPNLSELEEAFSIETVTDEFFEQYKTLFLTLKTDLDELVKHDAAVRAEFESKHIDTATFAKRLMGQLVFLYFIQKKGWLGVSKTGKWGDGPRDFLQQAYEGKVVGYDNFYDDVLEPLFYEGLATDRMADDHYFHHLGVRIPFLNGGLFEAIGGYDWVRVPIRLPNAHIGDVLKTFNSYNFTVQEDSPLDKEVAVDPEMLGKVFENLLEITDRKSKGAFYTPREIVHYMAQEALIHYLDRGLNMQGGSYTEQVSVADLTTLVRYADLALENDATTAQKGQETAAYNFKVPGSIRKHAGAVDGLLARVKVMDPAIGSGAFPMGVLTEIVRSRNVLSPFLKEPGDRSAYALKRHAIFESIYGVDIDAAAVDIAKLRLWLSLVVDEEDFASIKPLPNLDYKVVVGSSMSRIEGFTDFDAKGQIAALKDAYFNESNRGRKQQLRQQINEATQKVYAAAREWGQDGTFDFHVAFGEVFKEGGFDIAIGNPPYVRQEAIKDQKPALKKAFPDVYNGTADLYTYFYAAAVDVLKPGGVIAYITPNKWFKANYGKTLRRHLANRMAIHDIIDFGELPVFKTATTYPMIFIAERKSGRTVDTTLTEVKSLAAPYPDVELLVAEQGQVLPEGAIKGEEWRLMSSDLARQVEQMRSRGIPLGEYVGNKIYWGIKTGFNEAFVIDAKKREELVAIDPCSAEIIKPLAIGDDIRKWHIRDKNRYLIFTRRGIAIEKYPAILTHLLQFRERLEPRPRGWEETKKWPGRKPGSYKWYEIQDDIAYFREFDKPKIIYPEISVTSRFCYDTSGKYTNNKAFVIPTNDKYLLGVLGSNLVWRFLANTCTSVQGGALELKSIYMSQIPIPMASSDERQKMTYLVDCCLESGGRASALFENQIEELVNKLYGL